MQAVQVAPPHRHGVREMIDRPLQTMKEIAALFPADDAELDRRVNAGEVPAFRSAAGGSGGESAS